ncbi:MAG TPA: FAD-dependent monooxygenase, partial [Planctomycetaceae bacterium]|nr:FAD-dependent monooxygenase [Planctomycetaceae bacterium]
MAMANHPEVLVVGAGPVGLFTALNLAQRDIRIEIIDREWRTGAHSYALALHAKSLELLEGVGLRDEILRRAYRVCRIGLYEGAQRRAEIQLADSPDQPSALAVLRQDAFEGLLESALRRRGVRVRWNHELEQATPREDGVEATVRRLEKQSVGYAVARTEWVVAETRHIQPRYVVGADGHRSTVRRAMGAGFEPAGRPQTYAVFEFQTDADFQHEMRLMMGPHTTDVVWPLPDGHCRFSFQLEEAVPDTGRSKERLAVEIGRSSFAELTEEQLKSLLAQRAPWFDASVGPIRWRIVVCFEPRLTSCYGQGRMWLAGDAAHTTGPAGMQSMNVGLSEGMQLAGLVAGVLRHNQSPDGLAGYAHQRLDQWRRLLGLTGGLRPDAHADAW